MSITRRSLTLALGAMFALAPTRFAELARAFALDREYIAKPYRYAFSSTSVFDSAAVIGNVILNQPDIRPNLEEISSSLSKSLYDRRPGVQTALTKDKEATLLQKRLADSVASDFAEGRIIEVDGWLLAKTEAHLCAMAALQKERRYHISAV